MSKRRFKVKIPIGGPFIPSEKTAETVSILRERDREIQTLKREIEELGGHPPTGIDRPEDLQRHIEGVYAEDAAALVVCIRQAAVDGGLSASMVDSIFLALLTPGFLEGVALLGRQLDVVIGDIEDATPAVKLVKFCGEIDSCHPAVVSFFVRSWAYMNERYPMNPWAILGQVLAPLSPWYFREKPPRGPDPDVQSRVVVWGHLLISVILGTQVEALRFWHGYCASHPPAATLSYSAPNQPSCSERALSAFIVAKKRLFEDLEKAGLIAPATLTCA